MASDNGAGQMSSVAPVRIVVLDSNDNQPEFEEAGYAFRLSDTAERGQFVGKVRAVDLDESDSGQLRYAIVGGNAHQVFAMGEETGVVSLVNLHNFGKRTSVYAMNISVTDGVYSASSRITINLISVNSFAPEFESLVFEETLRENLKEGALVAAHKAVDGDRDDKVTYAIQSEAMGQLFKIDPNTGSLTALKSFDREDEDTYEVPIVATDLGGRSGFTTIKVNILDENDNKPLFPLREYRANVRANMTSGTPVIKVTAADADKGSNAAVSYSIYENATSEVSRVFEVDRASGQIRLKADGAGLENQIYQFFVRAVDGGGLHSDVPVEVYVMSPADRPPRFEKRDSVYFVSENGAVGEVLAQFEAFEEDTDNGGVENEIETSPGIIRYKQYIDEQVRFLTFFEILKDLSHLDRHLPTPFTNLYRPPRRNITVTGVTVSGEAWGLLYKMFRLNGLSVYCRETE